ncbi:MAG TPA: GAF domain-containing protein [Candidatus Latescibacteria bacterium]|nr:GAF domain-containing protein [Candidatus Latescibacterota bacterium]
MNGIASQSPADRDAEIRKLRTLLRVSKIMNAESNRAKVIQRINEEVREYVEADRFTVFFHDSDTDELYSYIASGLAYGEIRIPSTAGIAGAVFTSRETLRLADAYDDPRFNREIDRRTGYRTRSLLSMPIINQRGTCIGVVQALNKMTGNKEFSDEDVEFLKELVEQISDLLDLLLHKEELARRQAALQESLSRLAVYDYLLGEKTAMKVAMRWNRKLHLWIGVAGIIGLTLMAITGIVVAHVRGLPYVTMLDLHTGKAFLPRELAFTYSDLTGLFLAIVTLTGVVLWLYPVLTKWARRRLERKTSSRD